MQRALGFLVIFFMSALLCGTAYADKPEWWPDTGIGWPPPKPADWPADKVYPPVGKDLQWWLEHFRKRSHKPKKEGNPKNPAKDKDHAGHRVFSSAFPPIEGPIFLTEGLTPEKPDCGNFRLSQSELEGVETCKPFPAKTLKKLCKLALDTDSAEAKCKKKCAAGENKLCTKYKLYKPEMYVRWGCALTAASLMFDPEPASVAACRADFLCACLK